MKAKIFSAFFALALVVSFSLVTTAPAAANGAVPNPTFATVSVPGMTTPSNKITIGWERGSIPHSGTDAIHVTTSTATVDYAMVIVPTNFPLTTGTTISYWGYTAAGNVKAPDEIYLFLDMDNNGTFDIVSGDILLTSHEPGPEASAWYGLWHEWTIAGPENEWHIVPGYTEVVLGNYIDKGYSVLAIALTAGPSTTSGPVDVNVYFDQLTVNGSVVLDEDTGTINVPVPFGGFPTPAIQDAINAALPGDTINVAAGTYDEQVVINNKSLTLQGAGDTTIIQPSQATANTFQLFARKPTGSGNDTAPIVVATTSGATVNIQDLKIDGSLVSSVPGVDSLFAGILYRDTNGVIDAATIENINIANGNGMYLVGHDVAVSVEVKNCNVSSCLKNGITANYPNMSANVHDNTVVGMGPTDTPAQNGIQFGFGANGTISNNNVSGNIWTDTYGGSNDPATDIEADGACGILLYHTGSAPIEIQFNTLTANQFGIWTVGATSINIHDNDITGLAHAGSAYPTGIAVWDTDMWGYDPFGYTEVGTTGAINQNTFTSNDYGILVRDYTPGGALPSVSVTGNDFSNNNIQLKDTAGTLDIEAIWTTNDFDRAVNVDHPGASLLHTIWSKIQDAIDATLAGDTINVAAGTYDVATLITVNQAVTIMGPESGGAIVRGTTADNIRIFKIVTSDVTIKNLEITVASLGVYVGDELENALVGISGSALSNVSVENNILYVPLQSGPMSGWNARAITAGDSSSANVIISDNTIYNVRNGIVVRTGNTATVVDNIIFNTKGGIMNYTSNQGDANNRTVTGNSWASTVSGVISHNEWDIVWNTASYVPDYQQSVVGMSSSNNDAYVLDRRAADGPACANLTGNRSHIFIDAASSFNTAHPARGNFNEPFSSISLGVGAVVPGGIINVAAGTYTVAESWDDKCCIYINKNLTLSGAGSGSTILDAEHTYSCVNGPPCGPHCTVVWNEAPNVTMQGLTVKGGDYGIRNTNLYEHEPFMDTLVFDDVVVTDNYGHGFVFECDVNTVTMTDCAGNDNGDRGVYFCPGKAATNVTLTDTSANDNKHIGFNCQGSIANLIISGGTFNNNAGGYTNYDCDTQEGPWYGFGIELVDCVGTIDGVTAQDNGQDAAAPAEKGAGINIKGASSNVNITYSTLTGNPIGLWLENWDGNQPSPAAVAINNSNVDGNIDFGVKNGCTGVTVDAINNWWGASDGPRGVGPGIGDAVSANVDYDPWLRRESDVTPATGRGTVTFDVGDGGMTGLTAVAEATLPAAGKPAAVAFPYGLFSFNIIGIAPGSTVTVTITYPSAMPVGTQYWKFQNGVWVDCTSLLGDDDGDNVLTLTLTDGGLGDADGVPNGTIVDPGGPGVGVGGGGGWGGGGGFGGGGGTATAASACSLALAANMQGNIATVSMTKDGVLCATCVAKDAAGKYILEIDKGAKVMLAGNIVPLLLRFSEASTIPQAPENAVIVDRVYEFNAYASASATTPSPITISPPARLILTYDPDKLPKNASEVFIANYDTEKGWLALAPVSGVVAEVGKAQGQVSHFTTFAVLAKTTEPAPAKFRVGSLTVTPSQAKLNQEVNISVNVANTGGTSGSYSLEMKVNGISESTKQVTVAAGASQTVDFTITEAQPGTYTVDIAGQRGSFVVVGAGAPFNGGLIAIVIAAVLILATVVVLLVAFRRRAY